MLEELAVKAMAVGGGRYGAGNRSVADASGAQLRSFIEDKAAWYGRNVVILDR